MTIARDASSPARFSLSGSVSVTNTESGTSASFTPPANAWVYCSATFNSGVGASPTFSNPTNTGGGLGAWSLVKSQVNASGGAVAVWRAFVNSSVATTVTVSVANGSANSVNTLDAAAWCDVWTGAATTQTGAATGGGTSTTQNISPSINTTASGSQVGGVAVDWNAVGTPNSTDTADAYFVSVETSGLRVYKPANSGAAGSVSINFNESAGGPQWTYALYEILAPSGIAWAPRANTFHPGASPGYGPQRFYQSPKAFTAPPVSAAPFIPYETNRDTVSLPLPADFLPPNLLTQGTLKLPPFTQSNDGARTFWAGVYTDFAPPNLLAAKFLPPPPVASVDLSQQVRFRWSATDFSPPNLLADKALPAPPVASVDLNLNFKPPWAATDFAPPNLLAGKLLPSPPVGSIDLSQRVQFKWAATDFAPPNLLTPGTLKPPPFTQSEQGGGLRAQGVYSDFVAPNLALTLLAARAPFVAVDVAQITYRGVYTDFAAPNLSLTTLATAIPPPVLPQDISGIRLESSALRSDFLPPNLTLTLPVAPPLVSSGAGRHKSREDAHRRHHRDVLRARVEAFKEQRRAAEEALENSENREVRERTKVLKRLRVKATQLKKPLEQYAPVKRAIVQRNETLRRYRDILGSLERAQSAHEQLERELQQADEEAALYLMQFLMMETEWRE